jgi:hypothetical protein
LNYKQLERLQWTPQNPSSKCTTPVTNSKDIQDRDVQIEDKEDELGEQDEMEIDTKEEEVPDPDTPSKRPILLSTIQVRTRTLRKRPQKPCAKTT